MAWNTGDPPSDLSGNLTLYQVYDGDVVRICGRLNDRWLPTRDGEVAVTHWDTIPLNDPPEG